MRAALLFLVTASALAHAAGAQAQQRIALTWTAPAGVCPPAETFVAETEQALGPAAQGAASEPLRVDARVVLAPQGRLVLELMMHFADGDTSRALVGARCDALVRSGALVVALALAPDAAVDVEEEAPTTTPTPTPPPTPSPAPRPAPPSPPRARVAVEITALGLVDVGTMPGAVPGGAFGAGVRIDDLHVEALFVVLPVGAGELTGFPGAGGRFTLIAGRLAGALDLVRASSFALALSFAAELGDLAGRGYGVSMPASTHTFYPLLAAGARFTYDLGPVTLRLDVESLVPLLRQPFTLGTLGEVYTPSPLGLRVGIGAAVHFP